MPYYLSSGLVKVVPLEVVHNKCLGDPDCIALLQCCRRVVVRVVRKLICILSTALIETVNLEYFIRLAQGRRIV